MEETKSKKKTKFIIICCSILSAILISIFVRFYIIGGSVYNEEVSCKAKVEGNKVTLVANTIDSNSGISSINFKEDNGTVYIKIRGVEGTKFYKSSVKKVYTANGKIKRVIFNANILWGSGVNVSDFTNEIYSTRHSNIEETDRNEYTTEVLELSDTIGRFTSELQTDKKPYEWKLILESEFATSEEETLRTKMKSYAYILIGIIEDLDIVTYNFKVDGQECELSINADEASEFAGYDIKKCGKDIYSLQKLIVK